MVMAGLNPENVTINTEFIFRMSSKMSLANQDGLGYTGVDSSGNMFGERWLENSDAFLNRNGNGKRERRIKKLNKILKGFEGFLDFKKDDLADVPKVEYNKFGELTDKFSAITLHTRYATSAKGFENTHPFVDIHHDTSLIHNGIIQNVTKEDNIRSTCDSERILNKYLEHGVATNPDNIQKVIDDLTGYMACAIVTRDEEGKRVIDVFKTRARLHGVYIEELGLVITTDAKDAEKVADDMGLTVVASVEYKDNKYIRFDAITGKVIFVKDYKDTAHFNNVSYFNQTTKEVEKANAIVQSHTDVYNEEAAEKDDYYLDEHTKTWQKIVRKYN